MDLSIIFVAIIGLGSPVFLYFQNRANNKRLAVNDNNVIALEKEKLDGLVLDRARTLYEGMISQLETQATKLRDTIGRLETDLDEEREDNYKLRQRIKDLENQADVLEDQIYQLKLRLDRITNTEK